MATARKFFASVASVSRKPWPWSTITPLLPSRWAAQGLRHAHRHSAEETVALADDAHWRFALQQGPDNKTPFTMPPEAEFFLRPETLPSGIRVLICT